MAAELHLSERAIKRAVADLEGRAILRVQRHKRQVSTYHMLRRYGAEEASHPAQPPSPEPAELTERAIIAPAQASPKAGLDWDSDAPAAQSATRIDLDQQWELRGQIVTSTPLAAWQLAPARYTLECQIGPLNGALRGQIVTSTDELRGQIDPHYPPVKNPPEQTPPAIGARAHTRTPASARGGAGSVKSLPIPADWAPTAEDRLYAAQHGVDADLAAEDLRNYWGAITGPRACKSDWSRTYRNSVLRCADSGRYKMRDPLTGLPRLDPSRLTGAGALLYKLDLERAAQGLPPYRVPTRAELEGDAA
jgi:hypothetical protein